MPQRRPAFAHPADSKALQSGWHLFCTDLWSEVEPKVTTREWELFDIVHTVLPTRLPLEEFYREYASLWRHALDARYKTRGRARLYLQMAGALATGQTNLAAVKKGWNLAKELSRPQTFLEGHQRQGVAVL